MKRVDSPRVTLLYDIYHMQIMEGDVIRTIRRFSELAVFDARLYIRVGHIDEPA